MTVCPLDQSSDSGGWRDPHAGIWKQYQSSDKVQAFREVSVIIASIERMHASMACAGSFAQNNNKEVDYNHVVASGT